MWNKIKKSIGTIWLFWLLVGGFITLITATAKQWYKVDRLESNYEKIEERQDEDHDLLRDVARDVQWIVKYLEDNGG